MNAVCELCYGELIDVWSVCVLCVSIGRSSALLPRSFSGVLRNCCCFCWMHVIRSARA